MVYRLLCASNARAAVVLAVCLVAASLAASGCGGGGGEVEAGGNVDALLARGIKPNEMGMVMVLEYHRIEKREGDYTRSVENFRKDLQTLYEKGYRLVTFHDLMRGRIDVPAGTTPVVFSFDDTTEGQFRYIKDGDKTVIDPECAVGMMNDFRKKNPDFGYTALLNYLPAMFDQPDYAKKKVNYLHENGFEFGNHTVSHPSLGKVSDEQVQEEIALPVRNMKKLNPEVKVDVLCLPHGSIPKNEELMFKGSFDGVNYRNRWALLVGSNPFYPSYHYRNPGRLIPRIQVMDFDPEDGSGAEGSDYWLSFFDKRPELRFISDGNPATICAPAYMEGRLLSDEMPEGTAFVGY